MLTTEETDWIIRQRDALVDASQKADVYGDALAMLHAQAEPSVWNLSAWRARRKEHQRLATKWALWSATANRKTGVINAWLEVYHVTTGQVRGPIAVGDNGSRVIRG